MMSKIKIQGDLALHEVGITRGRKQRVGSGLQSDFAELDNFVSSLVIHKFMGNRLYGL